MEPLARAYLGNSLHLLGAQRPPAMVHPCIAAKRASRMLPPAAGQLTEGGTLAHTLRRLRPSAALLVCSERLQRKLLRRALSVFLSGSPTARVHAFLLVRQIALALPEQGLGAALKARTQRRLLAAASLRLRSPTHAWGEVRGAWGAAQGVTRAFTQGAKFVSASSAPHIAFMGACVIDLHGLNAGEAYQHAFGHIRQLAATLRGALSNRTKDAFREVYCWQTVCCLELWARLVAAHADKEARAPASVRRAGCWGESETLCSRRRGWSE